MTLISGGSAIIESAELLGSKRMRELVSELKSRYSDRYVIFDCPPLLALSDALVVSSLVDGVILVVEANRTPTDQILKAVELLDGRNVLGLVMNRGETGEYYY